MNQMSTQPVIMQIIPELGAGGAEQGCIDMAGAITAAGAKAIVVSNGGARIHELERAGATHINLPVHSKNPLVILRNIGRLRKLIERHNVSIVHVRSRAPAWSALYACRGTRARFLTTCHAPYNVTSELKRRYNSVIAQGELVIAISHYVADYLQKEYNTPASKIRVIHRGTALERFHPTAVTPERLITQSRLWRIPDGANIIMLPGRLTRWKGHHVLIDAMGQIMAQHPKKDIFCVLLGSDQGRTEYRKGRRP